MNTQFTCKVRYTKQLDNGALKRVSELYLVHSPTFGGAEEEIYTHLGSVIRGEFSVEAITKTVFNDIIIYDDADTLYEIKARYESIDSDTDKARKVTQAFLVTAIDAKEAYDRVMESLKQWLVDFEITLVRESKIIEVFEPTPVEAV